ncbi:MAG TPA: M28 family peptidase, partial [Nitrospira sp.]
MRTITRQFAMLICATATATWQIAASTDPVPLGFHDDDQTTVLSALQSISGARMLKDIGILSSSEFAGRQSGSDGDLKAAELVSQRFSSLHMTTPAPFQARSHEEPGAAMPVPVYSIQDNAHLELAGPRGSTSGRSPTDFLPILDSPSVNVTAPVVFAGYGIADPARSYDDYAGLDVQDKIVMFLRGKPEHYPVLVTHAEKERAARAHGAAAFLTVTGPIMNQYEVRRGMTVDPSAFYGGRDGTTPLAGAWISPRLADSILAADAQTLQSLQENMSRTRRPQSMLTSSTMHMVWGATESLGILRNVVAAIPGRNLKGETETILLGAHRDHFGHQAGLLFPGADDNASGTAVILEVARTITEVGLSPK